MASNLRTISELAMPEKSSGARVISA